MSILPPGATFDDYLAAFHTQIREVLPEPACEVLLVRIRVVHTDWPDLSFADCADLARVSLAGQRQQVKQRIAFLDEKKKEAEEQQLRNQAYVEALTRIEKALPDLERLTRLYPGRSSTAELLADAEVTWDQVGITEQDGALLDQMLAEEQA